MISRGTIVTKNTTTKPKTKAKKTEEKKDLRPSSYPLRIEQNIRDKLESAAARYGRSLNTEIAIRLEASLLQDAQAEPMPANEELMRRIAYEVAKQVVKEALENQGFEDDWTTLSGNKNKPLRWLGGYAF